MIVLASVFRGPLFRTASHQLAVQCIPPRQSWSQNIRLARIVRRPNRSFREFMLDSPKGMVVLPRVLLCPLESFDSCRLCFPRVCRTHRVTSTCRAMDPSASKLVAKSSPSPDRPKTFWRRLPWVTKTLGRSLLLPRTSETVVAQRRYSFSTSPQPQPQS